MEADDYPGSGGSTPVQDEPMYSEENSQEGMDVDKDGSDIEDGSQDGSQRGGLQNDDDAEYVSDGGEVEREEVEQEIVDEDDEGPASPGSDSGSLIEQTPASPVDEPMSPDTGSGPVSPTGSNEGPGSPNSAGSPPDSPAGSQEGPASPALSGSPPASPSGSQGGPASPTGSVSPPASPTGSMDGPASPVNNDGPYSPDQNDSAPASPAQSGPASPTPSGPASPTGSESPQQSPSQSRDGSPASPARSRSGSPARSRSGSPARSGSGSPARSRSGSPARSGSGSPARSRSGSPARSRSGSPARSRSGSERSGGRSRSGSPRSRSRSGSPRSRSRSGSPDVARSRSGSPRSRSGSPRSRSGSPRSRSGSPRSRSRSGSPRSRSGSPRGRSRSGSPRSRSRSGSPRSRSGSPGSRSGSSHRSGSPPGSPQKGSDSEDEGEEKEKAHGSDDENDSDKDELIADIFGSSDEDEEFEGFGEADVEAANKKKEKKKATILSDDDDDGNEESKATGEENEILPELSDDENEEAARQSARDDNFESDFDAMMRKKKEENKTRRRKRGNVDIINDNDDLIADMIVKMKEAAEEDRELNLNKKPAVTKLKFLPHVISQLKKADLHSAFLDCGILSAMTEWLAPLPDKSLPHLKIREHFLRILQEFPAISNEGLKASGIGKAVMYLYKHPKEDKENRERAGKLINEWSRPIFNLTSNFKLLSKEEREQRDYEQLPKKRRLSAEGMTPRRDIDRALAGEEKALRPGDKGWIMRARVPMPSHKDYVVRPKWSIEEGTVPKGGGKKKVTRYDRHARAFAEKKKFSKSQRAVTISIEGRNMAL